MASTRVDAGRYLDLKLNLHCPGCGKTGLIPWKMLHRVLYCGRCETLYRVEPDALVALPKAEHTSLAVQVRTNSSEWREHAIRLRETLSWKAWARRSLHEFAREGNARWVAAGMACVLLLFVLTWRPSPVIPRPIELPTALEERAALLAESLAKEDLGRTMALTMPPQHRRMRSWLSHECPVKPLPVGDQPPEIKADVLGVSRAVSVGNHTDVRLRVAGLPGGELVMVQQWVQHDDVWYFQPPAPIKTAVQPAGASPYAKPVRGGARR